MELDLYLAYDAIIMELTLPKTQILEIGKLKREEKRSKPIIKCSSFSICSNKKEIKCIPFINFLRSAEPRVITILITCIC
ncbi:hypothetical protein Patl1_37184 [Pistacia atlantica]|nr:hypothetical protein Patl1_37184 [Pistacia atlantica]